MNPNHAKDQDRTAVDQYPQTQPREKPRDDKAASKPDKRDEMKDPVGTAETNRPLDEGRDKHPGRNVEQRQPPREGQGAPKDPKYETDVLKPGR